MMKAGCERLCFLMIAVALFFIMVTDIYCVEEASEIRRSMRSWCLFIIMLMLALFVSPEPAALGPAKALTLADRDDDSRHLTLGEVMAWQQAKAWAEQQQPRDDAVRQALGFALAQQATTAALLFNKQRPWLGHV
jgi:hypothetical protein